MIPKISHNREDESIEAKAKWFRELSLEERMELLCFYTNLILENNPQWDKKNMLDRSQDVFKSFRKHNVKYVVIGEIAAILHGVPRATFDLDILIEATTENAQKLLDVLLEIGLATALLTTARQIVENEITIFQDIIRIDVQTQTLGINFKTAWKNREIMKFRDQEFYVLSKKDLIASKRAAGRKIDLEDVHILELGDREK